MLYVCKSFNGVFYVQFIMEFVSGVVNHFLEHKFLLPGLLEEGTSLATSRGLLAAELFNMSIMSMGLVSLHVVLTTKPWAPGRASVALAAMFYHILIAFITWRRLSKGWITDGPQPESGAIAVMGIVVHLFMFVRFGVFMWCRKVAAIKNIF